jgi:integrase
LTKEPVNRDWLTSEQGNQIRNFRQNVNCLHVISYGGLPIAKMRRAWKTACKKSGVDANPHDLRRTFASWAMQAGHSCAKIASAIGTTEKIVEHVYGHLSPDRLRDVVASVARQR